MTDTACATVNPALLELNLGDLGQHVNLAARQGADADVLVVTLANADGSAVDLTGASVLAQIRRAVTDAAAVAVFDATVTAAEIRLALPAATLATLTAGATLRDRAGLHVFDARATFVDGSRRWLCWGELRVLQPVTR